MARSKTSKTLPQLLHKIEDFVTRGEDSSARPLLGRLSRTPIPRQLAVKVANLSRRIGQAELAVRLLHPIVRPSPRSPIRATDGELCEYAAGLTSIGAVTEALGILGGVNIKIAPEGLLYKAIALFTQWNYGPAIPLLQTYIGSKLLTSYQQCVGRLNLLAAYVSEGKDQETTFELSSLLRDTKKFEYSRLYGNCLELSAQNAVRCGQWKDGEDFAKKAEEWLSRTGSADLLYARKWLAICRLQRTGQVDHLEQVRRQAIQMRHYETVRECDLYRSILTDDKRLLTRIYFATPYEGYRRRLFSQVKFPLDLPKEYCWDFGLRGNPRAILSLATGMRIDKINKSQIAPVLHGLLAALAFDLYRPQRIATLHANLFPGEYFFPHSSPARIHQLLKRLRHWFCVEDIPINLPGEKGAYALTAMAPMGLIISKVRTIVDTNAVTLRRLTTEFSESAFSAQEMAKTLQMSKRSAQRFLQSASHNGTIEREGLGPSTFYRIRRR